LNYGLSNRDWFTERGTIFFSALVVFYALGLIFPEDIDYLFIIIASYSFVNYFMLIIDWATGRWQRWHSRYLLLLGGILLTTVGADLWLKVALPNLDSGIFVSKDFGNSFVDAIFVDLTFWLEFHVRPQIEERQRRHTPKQEGRFSAHRK
jgi:hypothetical protein